jgi:hypothetical protein
MLWAFARHGFCRVLSNSLTFCIDSVSYVLPVLPSMKLMQLLGLPKWGEIAFRINAGEARLPVV